MKRNICTGAIISLLFLSACKEKPVSYSLDCTRDHITADLLLSDIMNIVDAEARITDGIKSTDYPCLDAINIDTLTNPATMLLTFLEGDCPSKFGWDRLGTLFVGFDGKYSQPGTKTTVDIQEFYIEGWEINGNLVMEYGGENSSNQPFWNVVINNVTFDSPDGTFSRWSANYVRQMVEGHTTTYTIDDVFKINGTASGTDRRGDSYSAIYDGTMRSYTVCPIPTKGTVGVSLNDDPDRTISYGTGNCDDVVEMKINDQNVLYTFP